MLSIEKAAARLHFDDVVAGFRQLLPISVCVVIFGVAFGLAAVQTGLDEVSILTMSSLVFAGASQFAVLKLWGEHVPLVPLMVTVFAVNARHLRAAPAQYGGGAVAGEETCRRYRRGGAGQGVLSAARGRAAH